MAGIIGGILKLINLQTLFISLIIIFILSKKKRLNLLKKLSSIDNFNLTKRSQFNNLRNSKSEAAKQSLKSIDQLINLIQNQIAVEGLKQEKERVQKELLRGDLVIVVFGTGSSGKTSLIRALLKKIVGEVGPIMGSTEQTKSYRLRLRDIERGIQIIDTPGIFEGGIKGRSREKSAFLNASRADLILFVVDSDLRAGEMELITKLSKIGKKLFLILNKCDLRGAREEEKLIGLLKDHCTGLMDPADIVPVVASPQSIPIVGSRPLQPKPEINKLIKRMAFVLHEEGEELIADNILLQCRNLGLSGRKLLDNQRLRESKRSIERYAWISTGVVFITPLPGIDLLGTAVVNGRMVMEISKIYGVNLNRERAKDLAMSVGQTIAGLGIIKGGLSIISNSLTLNLPTYLIGRTIQSVTAAWLTKVAGESFITYFQQDQDWGDGGIQEVVQRHYDLNKRESNLRIFIHSAMNRVIRPLEKSKRKQLPPHQELQGEEASWDHESQEY
ncbi:YcjF family protein [Prochlorococcus marinus]|uniref:YcjF family protein n=1 Tax=Prochlorococcus marinus TaxID=1219 RepID=UPI0022B5A37F|nr:GTP-binding protein [Prochlorococcus marinus]